MGYEIRKYRPSDREAMRDICHRTATAPEYVGNKDLVAALYCEYYTDYEPDNVFVLAGPDDVPAGYVLCAENYKSYIRTFREKQLPKVAAIDRRAARLHRLGFVLDRLNGRKYPAHLHVDILPEAQRQGYGTKLVDALVDHLREKGVKGVCLGVGGDNEAGIGFYRKYGFTLYRNFGKLGKIFVLDLAGGKPGAK